AYRMKQNDQYKKDTAERIQKVRSMWTCIAEMLTSLEKEKEVVESVLEGCVNPCILDGTNVVLSVPGLLTYRVESDEHEFCTGNLYEDEKLNFLTVIQLLNEALRILRDEYCPCDLKELHRIENMVAFYSKRLQNFRAKSPGNEKQHCVRMCQSASMEIWEMKWKRILRQCPLDLKLKENLVSSIQFI
ncbi:HAUS6 protein, partial [Atrichornis clamosus]|nr:HAUS6 protein [Atrichornis clamosus]